MAKLPEVVEDLNKGGGNNTVIIGGTDSSYVRRPTYNKTAKSSMDVIDLSFSEGQEWKDEFAIIQAGAIVPNLKRP